MHWQEFSTIVSLLLAAFAISAHFTERTKMHKIQGAIEAKTQSDLMHIKEAVTEIKGLNRESFSEVKTMIKDSLEPVSGRLQYGEERFGKIESDIVSIKEDVAGIKARIGKCSNE